MNRQLSPLTKILLNVEFSNLFYLIGNDLSNLWAVYCDEEKKSWTVVMYLVNYETADWRSLNDMLASLEKENLLQCHNKTIFSSDVSTLSFQY